MAALLADGARHLAAAFERLDPAKRGKDNPSPTEAADAAVKIQRQLKRVYRQAASALLTSTTCTRSRAGGSCTGASPASARP
jgi:hypothetical protein